MRRHIIMVGMLALTGIFAACSTETTAPVEPADEMITIRLSTNGAPEIVDGAGTKTMLSGMSVHWQEGDQILLAGQSSTEYGKKLGTLTCISTDGNNATFQGEVIEGNWSNSINLYAIYPIETSSVTKASFRYYDVTFTPLKPSWTGVWIPFKQTLEAGTFTRGANFSVASIAKDSDGPLYFKNYTGLLELGLTGTEKITKVEITSPKIYWSNSTYEKGIVHNDPYKATTLEYSGQNNEITFTENSRSDTTPTVILANDGGVQLTDTAQKFYACVMPYGKANMTNGKSTSIHKYTIKVTKADGTTVTLTTDVLTEYPTSGRIARLGTFNIE